MNNCTTCAHSVFDKRWGEYKCLKLTRRIYDPRERINCEMYEKGEVRETETEEDEE